MFQSSLTEDREKAQAQWDKIEMIKLILGRIHNM